MSMEASAGASARGAGLAEGQGEPLGDGCDGGTDTLSRSTAPRSARWLLDAEKLSMSELALLGISRGPGSTVPAQAARVPPTAAERLNKEVVFASMARASGVTVVVRLGERPNTVKVQAAGAGYAAPVSLVARVRDVPTASRPVGSQRLLPLLAAAQMLMLPLVPRTTSGEGVGEGEVGADEAPRNRCRGGRRPAGRSASDGVAPVPSFRSASLRAPPPLLLPLLLLSGAARKSPTAPGTEPWVATRLPACDIMVAQTPSALQPVTRT